MASWWVPEDVAFVDALPMTATGKIHKVTLPAFKDFAVSRQHDAIPAQLSSRAARDLSLRWDATLGMTEEDNGFRTAG